jgi:hypothetical protein
MTFIKLLIAAFAVLEAANVIVLYFFPNSKLANGIGVFKAWEQSKEDPALHDFTSYLVNWVAGTKLIFILLLLVILYTADDQLLVLTAAALAIAISSFFWRLFPLARKMDRGSQLDPQGYSAVLGGMILVMVLLFAAAAVWSIAG